MKIPQLILILLIVSAARVNGAELKTAANVMVEISFEVRGEPNEQTLDVAFTEPSGAQLVPPQRAMRFAAASPAVRKSPPAYTMPR